MTLCDEHLDELEWRKVFVHRIFDCWNIWLLDVMIQHNWLKQHLTVWTVDCLIKRGWNKYTLGRNNWKETTATVTEINIESKKKNKMIVFYIVFFWFFGFYLFFRHCIVILNYLETHFRYFWMNVSCFFVFSSF